MFYVSSYLKGYCCYLLILIGCDLHCQNTYSDLCNVVMQRPKGKFISDPCDKELLVMYVAIEKEGFGKIWQGSTVQKFCWVQNFCTVGSRAGSE